MNNRYYEEIIKILSPLIGKSMSESSVKLQCKKMGISEDAITKNNLEDLTRKLFPGLKTFLGADKANQIAASLNSIK